MNPGDDLQTASRAMNPGPNRLRRDHQRADRPSREWSRALEDEVRVDADREAEAPAEKDANGVKDHRETQEQREDRELPRVGEAREAEEVRVESSPRKGLRCLWAF